MITPRTNPNSTPNELSNPFKFDFCIILENTGVNKDKTISETIKHSAMLIKISSSQF